MDKSSQPQPEQLVSEQNKPSPDTTSCQKELTHNAYTVGWVCALPKEQIAARAMLDEEHKLLKIPRNDSNAYILGSIGDHNIVIACLPNMGTNSAATVATLMISTFQSIRVGLMVGIGGGIPSKVHLGDVVVSRPVAKYHGVVQWDMGKVERGGQFRHQGSLNRPPNVLINAANKLEGDYVLRGTQIPKYLADMERKFPRLAPKYTTCAHLQDPLLVSEKSRTRQDVWLLSWFWQIIIAMIAYLLGSWMINPVNEHWLLSWLWQMNITVIAYFLGLWVIALVNIKDPQSTEKVEGARTPREIRVHYGLIASGNKVVKDAQCRDALDQAFGEHVLCVEMEAAGLMNDFPCIVIRGICDYADTSKEKSWQEYAAAVAAAYAKELLGCVLNTAVADEAPVKNILKSMQEQISSVQQTTAATRAATDSIRSDLHVDKIKRWLTPPDPSFNANHARTLRQEGTGRWLLDHPVFKAWHSGSCRQIWLYGLAGCGKSVLSTTVLDYLAAQSNDSLILSFFFDFNDIAKQTLDGMFRSLAFQLYNHGGVDSADYLDALFQTHHEGSEQPATKVLWDAFSKMLVAQRKVYIIIDALDESKTWDPMVDWIKDQVNRPELNHVQLFLTSRPESVFFRDLPPLIGSNFSLEIDQKATDADIRLWVTAQLSQQRAFTERSLSQNVLEKIKDKVGNGAEGMFRWAFCQLDTLARCNHEEAIENALESLPQGLNETYQRMYESIRTDDKDDARRLLQFLVYAEQPLTMAEAKEIIATRINNNSQGFSKKRRVFSKSNILAYCSSFVTILDAEEQELHLAHFSVKEYLLKHDHFNVPDASSSITMTCLTYLTDIDDSEEEINKEFPLARYAAKIWTFHARLSQKIVGTMEIVNRFLEQEETFQRWTGLYQADRKWVLNPGPPEGSRLYYACLSGLRLAANNLINKGADPNVQGGFYGNALQAASASGHLDIITLLLDKGADPNVQGGEYGNALQAASASGHLDIIMLLLDKGADPNIQGGFYGNALQAASESGHLDIIMLLLDKGADPNVQGGEYGNALQAASASGHLDIITLLLDKGADPNVQGGLYGNALQAASASGHLDTIMLLLDKGADPNIQGGFYGNALQAASKSGHLDIITLLLDKGADPNVQGGLYGNALQAASASGHLDIIMLLLDKGADPNVQGGLYSNALQAASASGHLDIITLLLDKGADPNLQGGGYGNALQAASANGHLDIITLLLDKGADPNVQGGFYGNALQAASKSGHLDIITMLLDKGAEHNL